MNQGFLRLISNQIEYKHLFAILSGFHGLSARESEIISEYISEM